MAPGRFVGTVERVKPAALASLALTLLVGCYSMTPHRAEVVSSVEREDCKAAIGGVFAQAGFVQLPTPPGYSMFFAPRTSGPYTSFLGTGSGVGVSFPDPPDGSCHLALEPLSPGVDCRRYQDAFADWDCQAGNTDGTIQRTRAHGVLEPCPTAPPLCEMSYAPGAENDAAVDELARRIRERLRTIVSLR